MANETVEHSLPFGFGINLASLDFSSFLKSKKRRIGEINEGGGASVSDMEFEEGDDGNENVSYSMLEYFN